MAKILEVVKLKMKEGQNKKILEETYSRLEKQYPNATIQTKEKTHSIDISVWDSNPEERYRYEFKTIDDSELDGAVVEGYIVKHGILENGTAYYCLKTPI